MKKQIDSFLPKKVMLMGAAPASVPERVLKALCKPVISHLDTKFIEMMQELRYLIQYIFQTKNELTFPIPGPASGAMEACFINLVEDGDKVIVCENGLYGERMSELLTLYKANVVSVHHEWGKNLDLNAIEDTLKKNPEAKVVCAVHGESSTGVMCNIQGLAALCRYYDKILVVDVVATIINSPLKVDEWGIDVAYANTHKCIGSIPGLSPITISERAIELIQNRKTPVRSYFLNFNLIMQHWYKQNHIYRTYHHTAPVNSLYGLHEALLMIYEEGLENLNHRYFENSKFLTNGLEEMGLQLDVPSHYKIPVLNMIKVQPHWNQHLIIQKLYDRHNIQISGGMGKTSAHYLRIAAMGEHNNRSAINFTLEALADILNIHRG